MTIQYCLSRGVHPKVCQSGCGPDLHERFFFGGPGRRATFTADLAAERNRFVAAISDEVLIPFAAPGSKTETLALDLLKSGKAVYTFSDRPGPLLDAGARLIEPDFLSNRDDSREG